eukprot:scaffold13840_cov69-Cyclotella_meneghiniana.AAC.5
MDPTLCTQPPEISDTEPFDAHHVSTGVSERKKRKSKLKSNRQNHSLDNSITKDQVEAALAAARARVAAGGEGQSATNNTVTNNTNADDVVDLTASPKDKSTKQNSVPSEKKTKPIDSAAASTAVTPTPLQNASADNVQTTLPHAPMLTVHDGGNETQRKRLKVRDEDTTAAARISLDSAAAKASKSGKRELEVVTSSKETKIARVSLEPAEPPTSKSAEVKERNTKSNSSSKESSKVSNEKKARDHPKTEVTVSDKSSKMTQPAAKTSEVKYTESKKINPPARKKKRSFHDQILYTMLTSSRPYTLKSLAKECNTTTEALNHAMLSFLDKKLVISKDFPTKKGEKKLFWANPMSTSEIMGGKTAVAKELSKLIASSEDMAKAESTEKELTNKLRLIGEELRPLLAVPTLTQLDDEIAREEKELQQLQSEIMSIRQRTEAASKPTSKPLVNSYSRLKKPPSKPRDKTNLKRSINTMTCEYKKRKRQCMDFVENLADAMEKKVKDATKLLDLETDEAEWGCWKDEASGKIYGTKKGKGVLDEEDVKVRIPSKYDV